MKSIAILVLLLAVLFISDRLVRIENQRYALMIGSCPSPSSFLHSRQTVDPAVHMRQAFDCLDKVQMRTSWFWHLYYGLTESLPAVPPLVQQLNEDRYGHLFPRGDDGAELAAAEKAFLLHSV
jgi:hypothetical protein